MKRQTVAAWVMGAMVLAGSVLGASASQTIDMTGPYPLLEGQGVQVVLPDGAIRVATETSLNDVTGHSQQKEVWTYTDVHGQVHTFSATRCGGGE